MSETGESTAGRDSLLEASVYCGAHTHVSLVSDGDQGECGTTFTAQMDDPECPTDWWPCPKCGAECEVVW